MKKIPNILIIFSIIAFIISLFSYYFLFIVVAVLVLNFLFILFWYPDHPPTVLGAMLMVWLSITSGYFYILLTGSEIRNLLYRPFYSLDNIDKAFWLALFGLVFLSLGLKFILSKVLTIKINYNEVEGLNILKLIILFIFFSPLTEFLFSKTRFIIPGISQFFALLKIFRWSIFFLIVVAVFHTKRMMFWFWVLFFTGIILGFTSFFSSFKDYLFYLAISYLSIRTFSYKQVVGLTLIGIAAFLLGVYWSYIKQDYREFLSGGLKAQIVVVSKKEALKKFFSYLKYFDKQRFKYGEEAMIKRVFYLEYFSATIRNIPTYRPYMRGYNTLRAVRHVTMPRFLFPNKPPLDDSKHTTELTGIYVSPGSKGTSISTGYMAEFYADYGPFWMFVPIFFIGVLWGFIYRLIIYFSKSKLWGIALTVPMFQLMSGFGKDLTKLLGDTIWYLITAMFLIFVINKFYKFFEIKEEIIRQL